jgi:hypothetical protein
LIFSRLGLDVDKTFIPRQVARPLAALAAEFADACDLVHGGLGICPALISSLLFVAWHNPDLRALSKSCAARSAGCDFHSRKALDLR